MLTMRTLHIIEKFFFAPYRLEHETKKEQTKKIPVRYKEGERFLGGTKQRKKERWRGDNVDTDL